MKSLVPGNIIAGFKKCGVYPYDPNAIVVPGEAKKKKQQPRVDEASSTMSQSDKDSDTNEDEDGGGGGGGGDGVMTVGVTKTKTVVPVMNIETMECLLITDMKILHCLIKISWNFMRDILRKDIHTVKLIMLTGEIFNVFLKMS